MSFTQTIQNRVIADLCDSNINSIRWIAYAQNRVIRHLSNSNCTCINQHNIMIMIIWHLITYVLHLHCEGTIQRILSWHSEVQDELHDTVPHSASPPNTARRATPRGLGNPELTVSNAFFIPASRLAQARRLVLRCRGLCKCLPPRLAASPMVICCPASCIRCSKSSSSQDEILIYGMSSR